MAALYLFVATSSAAGLSREADIALRKLFGNQLLALNVGQSGQYWSRGLVLRMYTRDSISDWKPWLTGELKNIVQFWLMHDGSGRAIDNMSDGPGLMNLQKLGSKSVHQLFLRYDDSNERASERVAKLLEQFEQRKVNCRYAFDFGNGRAYFMTSLQATETIFRRCQDGLRASIDFTLIGPDERCFGWNGELEDEEAWTVLGNPPMVMAFAS